MASAKKRETAKTQRARARVSLAVHSDATRAKALVSFRKSGTVAEACKIAGISRATWYRWMEEDPAFAAEVMEASENVTDELETEAIQRAKDGSDTLITFLLRARRPQLYREKQTIEVVSPDVQSRLQQQADAILELCPPDIARQLVERLRAIWS